MARPHALREGKTLLIGKNHVHFGLYDSQIPGQRVLRVSDPWSYLRFYAKRSFSRDRRNLMLAYLAQAEALYNAANTTPQSSKPLLYYYSFLNLSKALLARSYKKADLDSAQHGIWDPAADKKGYVTFTKQKVKFVASPFGNKNSLQIFPALYAHFVPGQMVPATESMLLHLLEQVVAIHRTYMLATDAEGSFTKLRDPEFRVNKETKEVWARLKFRDEDYNHSLTHTKLKDDPEFRAFFHFVEEPQDHAKKSDGEKNDSEKHDCFEQISPAVYRQTTETAIRELRLQLKGLKIHQLILYDEDSYRFYYCIPKKSEIRWPQIIPMYAVMFTFSSIVRYRPGHFEKLLEGKYGWLINEFINIVPRQFLMLMTNEITKTQLTHSLD